MMLLKSFWIAKNLHKDIIYTLPTQADVWDMAGGKVNRLVAQNIVLGQWTKDHDTVEQKTVGDNIIYWRGTFTTKAAMMVSSSLNIHDEVDASDQRVIEQYETRLMANPSDKRWRWYFSHPLLVGHGVHKYYLMGDQKHWFVTCPSCKKEHYMDWNTEDPNKMSVDIEKKIFICKHCKAPLSDDDRRHGRWVAKYKDKEFSSYWISQLMCPMISAEKIVKDFKEKSAEYFCNYVLGLPYIGSGNQVTREIITRNIQTRVNTQEGRIIIGVDSGLPMYVTIGNKDGIFYYGTVKRWEEIEAFMKRWPTSIVVADQGGDLIGVRKLQDSYPNRVYLCYYRTDRKKNEIITWGENSEAGVVVVDRNKAIQMVIDEFTDRRIALFGTVTDYEDYITHWLNIYRTAELDNLGMPRYIWERSGADHLVHSTVYWRVGMDRFIGNDVTFSEPKGFMPTEGYEHLISGEALFPKF
jgi:hypothetical protein